MNQAQRAARRAGAAIALAIALALPWAAKATLVYVDGSDDYVELTADPCPPEIAVRAPEGTRGYYRAATVGIDGADHDACAAAGIYGGRMVVHVIGADGREGLFPAELFEYVPDPRPGI